jgi:hypothetical protein
MASGILYSPAERNIVPTLLDLGVLAPLNPGF